jgi:hypothetical protein
MFMMLMGMLLMHIRECSYKLLFILYSLFILLHRKKNIYGKNNKKKAEIKNIFYVNCINLSKKKNETEKKN